MKGWHREQITRITRHSLRSHRYHDGILIGYLSEYHSPYFTLAMLCEMFKRRGADSGAAGYGSCSGDAPSTDFEERHRVPCPSPILPPSR